MELDNNKTAETHRATAVAAAYLDARGFKPIETEVTVRDGWIADLASFVYPTRTEMKKLKLMGYKNILKKVIDYEEFIYRYSTPLTAIVEVKVTIADFKKDINRKFGGIFPAHICYLAYPYGLIDELPAGWLGIELSKDCERILKITEPPLMKKRFSYDYTLIHPQNPGDIIDLIASVAIRREHRTRYASMRDWLKTYRAEKREKEKVSDLKQFCHALKLLLTGDILEKQLFDYVYIPQKEGNLKKSINKLVILIKEKLKK